MADLADIRKLGAANQGLAVVSLVRGDGTVASSVVNAGVHPHPATGVDAVAFVALGSSVKLAVLRRRPRATVLFRSGWAWAAADGPVDLAGPDDPFPGLDADGIRLLLRDVFTSAGGTHDDWDTYDRVMAEEGRTAVFVTPERCYGRSP